jgi:hypothetical protein
MHYYEQHTNANIHERVTGTQKHIMFIKAISFQAHKRFLYIQSTQL